MTDDDMKYRIQEAFGWAEDQLLKEWEFAEQLLKDNPKLREEIKAPEDEFEKIMKRLKEEKA